MINEENLIKLYNGVVEGTELTTKQLNEYGFNSKDLNELIQEGSIERLKRGLYSLKSVDELFRYGKKLISKKQYEKATQCFEKCYEIDPTHLSTCFQLFLRSIQNQDYERTFEFYENLAKSENEFYQVDANYYLYLLSIITDVPEKYRQYARYLKFNDIKIPVTDKRYKDIELQNKIRIAVLQRKFPYALKQLKDLINKHGSLTLQDFISEILLYQAKNAESMSKNTIVDLIKQKKYNEVVEHLLDKEERHNLSKTEEYILKLSETIINIQETNNVSKCKNIIPKDLFEAIDANNFYAALRIDSEYNERYNIPNENNSISLLLSDICSLINSITNSKQKDVVNISEETVISNEKVMPKEENNQSEVTNNETSSVVTMTSVFSYLIKNDLDNAFLSLKNYMESIGKIEYEFLIINLIKISLLEKDITFTKPMIALTLISTDNYTFDISSYIQYFYVALSQNDFEEARIYLDIISKANKLGQDCIITDGLYQVLENSEKVFNYKTENYIIEKTNEVLTYSRPEPKQKEIEERLEDLSMEATVKDEGNKSIESNIVYDKRDSEREFIAKKHEELVKQKGVILLKPMNNARINRIFDMVDEYSDMVAFVIDIYGNQQVVLRYKPKIKEFIDIKKISNIAKEAYKNGNYDATIEANLKLFQVYQEPKSFDYSKLGLAYLKKHNIYRAVDYLTIATALAKKENTDLDFSDLIFKLKGKNSLKGNNSDEDCKPNFKMNDKDFDYNDINNYYGIDNFDVINSYIIESGLDVESACEQLNCSSEEIDIIRLIYARGFYAQGNFEKGDLFMSSVEKNKNKTSKVKNIFEEIRKNRIFYQYRPVKKSSNLVLSLISQKKKRI